MTTHSNATESERRRYRQRKNTAYQLRIDGYRWNLSQMAKALNRDRATIRNKLKAAGIEPVATVHGTSVFELSEAIPVLFGAAPRGRRP